MNEYLVGKYILNNIGLKMTLDLSNDIRIVTVMVGPPGCGKGTQCYKLKTEHNFEHLSTGDMLREEIKNNTDLGKTANEIMKKGELVSDELVINIINEKLNSIPKDKNIIFDGFPRTKKQAEELDKILESKSMKLTRTFIFEIKEEVLEKRICGRRTHKASGRV